MITPYIDSRLVTVDWICLCDMSVPPVAGSPQFGQAAFGFAELSQIEQAAGNLGGFDLLAGPLRVVLGKSQKLRGVADKSITALV